MKRSWRLNERHYGALQGLDKAETLEKYGPEQFQLWRRSFDVPPPPLPDDSEWSQAHDPRYAGLGDDLPAHRVPEGRDRADAALLGVRHHDATSRRGKTVLVTAHGNSLRALVKHLDDISDDDIAELNIPTGIPLVYRLDEDFAPIEPASTSTRRPPPPVPPPSPRRARSSHDPRLRRRRVPPGNAATTCSRRPGLAAARHDRAAVRDGAGCGRRRRVCCRGSRASRSSRPVTPGSGRGGASTSRSSSRRSRSSRPTGRRSMRWRPPVPASGTSGTSATATARTPRSSAPARCSRATRVTVDAFTLVDRAPAGLRGARRIVARVPLAP